MVVVGIPVYKAKDTLPKALDSLVAQTKDMFIVHLVIDGDGEDYSEIVEDYKNRGLNIKVTTLEENVGPGMARQHVIDENPMCDYIMFVDADDMLMPRAVERLYKEAKINDSDILFGEFIVERKHQPGFMLNDNTTTWFHGKIYKRSYLVDNGIRFREDLRMNEDAYFNVVAMNHTTNKRKLPEVVYLWRDNENSLTRADGEKGFFEKSSEGYIQSQVLGMLKLVELDGTISPGLLGATCINLYNFYARADYYKLDYDEKFSKWMKMWHDCAAIQMAFAHKAFWIEVSKLLHQCEWYGDDLFFFKERFVDWLERVAIKKEEQ